MKTLIYPFQSVIVILFEAFRGLVIINKVQAKIMQDGVQVGRIGYVPAYRGNGNSCNVL